MKCEVLIVDSERVKLGLVVLRKIFVLNVCERRRMGFRIIFSSTSNFQRFVYFLPNEGVRRFSKIVKLRHSFQQNVVLQALLSLKTTEIRNCSPIALSDNSNQNNQFHVVQTPRYLDHSILAQVCVTPKIPKPHALKFLRSRGSCMWGYHPKRRGTSTPLLVVGHLLYMRMIRK